MSRSDYVDVYIAGRHYLVRRRRRRWVKPVVLSLATFGAWPVWRYLRYLFEGR